MACGEDEPCRVQLAQRFIGSPNVLLRRPGRRRFYSGADDSYYFHPTERPGSTMPGDSAEVGTRRSRSQAIAPTPPRSPVDPTRALKGSGRPSPI
jgi:hypothetical protein